MLKTWAERPSGRARGVAIGIAVLVVVAQYYATYLHGDVSTLILDHFHMSVRYYALIAVLGNLIGASAAFIGALADRFGRVPMMLGGLVATSVVLAVAVPIADNKPTFLVLSVMANACEAIVVVATAAYIRDLSPSAFRGVAMGWWAMGPVLGGVIGAAVAAPTLHAGVGWRGEYRICGLASALVAVAVLALLRDVAPAIRDRPATPNPLGEPLPGKRGRAVVIASFGFGLAEIFYFTLVAFFVLYATRGLGFTTPRANALVLCFYAGTALGFVVFGWLGDRLGWRRPIIYICSLLSSMALVAWVLRSPDPRFGLQAALLALVGLFGAASAANWLAGFTDLLDQNNPASVARGFAVWGAVVRIAIVSTLVAVAVLVPDLGVKNLDPARHAALLDHWKVWWWVCVAGRLLFLPTVALLPTQSPLTARSVV